MRGISARAESCTRISISGLCWTSNNKASIYGVLNLRGRLEGWPRDESLVVMSLRSRCITDSKLLPKEHPANGSFQSGTTESCLMLISGNLNVNIQTSSLSRTKTPTTIMDKIQSYNFQAFRDCLATPLIEQSAQQPIKSKKSRSKSGRKTAIKPIISERAEPGDADDLSEFIDVMCLGSIFYE